MRTMTVRALTKSYIVALGLIALLSVVSHFILANTLSDNQGSAAIIGMSGRQRMLSQRISASALQLRLGDESARAPLRTAISEFRHAHEQLVRLANDPGTDRFVAARLRDTYFGSTAIDRQSRLFIAAAGDIVDRSPAAAAPIVRRLLYSPDLAFLIAAARGPLLAGLEQIVRIHQEESVSRTEKLEMIQWGILFSLLATLILEAVCIFRPMILSMIVHVRRLSEIADNDYLTGVATRRAFTSRAQAEIARSQRHGRQLTALVLDADNFKRVNDTHGHLVGDAVLIALARTLADTARREDLVGRIGGEEFAMLLPETSLAKAGVVADRIRLAVAGQIIDAYGVEVAVTVSIGLADVPLDATDPLQTALAMADKMLYRAKDAGRNCVFPRLASTGAAALA